MWGRAGGGTESRRLAEQRLQPRQAMGREAPTGELARMERREEANERRASTRRERRSGESGSLLSAAHCSVGWLCVGTLAARSLSCLLSGPHRASESARAGDQLRVTCSSQRATHWHGTQGPLGDWPVPDTPTVPSAAKELAAKAHRTQSTTRVRCGRSLTTSEQAHTTWSALDWLKTIFSDGNRAIKRANE